ncbi:DUF4345 domain-containing protein [Methylopila sp. M107]|uniref:DUF4345 domain-containing protein n=1 Tax=Methylopila sp. M107 TaxID=1101190 RepID=UPI000373CC4E|nr:DUF4345 domain-containing protein [Methylopila sp. M107]
MIRERNAFRLVVAAVGLIPVCGGLLGAVGGAQAFAPGLFDVSLDSHVRYLSGLLLGIGLAFFATLKTPEAHAARYRMLTAIVVAGGLARLAGVVADGPPDTPMTLALGVELVVTPLICLWQARLARRA